MSELSETEKRLLKAKVGDIIDGEKVILVGYSVDFIDEQSPVFHRTVLTETKSWVVEMPDYENNPNK